MKTSTPKKSEIDLRVAQELKNNQDFIYQTNQSLNNLKEEIKSLSQQQEKVVAKCGNDITKLFIRFEKLSDFLLTKYRNIDQRTGDIQSGLSKVVNQFSALNDEVQTEYLTKESFSNALYPECQRIDAIEKDLVLKNDYFNLAIHQLKCQFHDQLERVRKELTPTVPEVDPVQQKIDERFQVFKVDFDGLVREISLLKNAVAYDQKKFENIYTLIERLKEGLCHKKE